jgi:hypothetical protein
MTFIAAGRRLIEVGMTLKGMSSFFERGSKGIS